MTRLLLIRHGETEWNKIHRVQGQTDVPLNEKGRVQARRVGVRLAHEREVAAIYASDLERALHTATEIAVHHRSLKVDTDIRLREIMLGAWETRLWQEIEKTEPDLVRRWRQDFSKFTPHGGESVHSMSTRLQDFLDDVVQKHPGETIFVVAHGGAIRMVIALALECPLKMAWRFGTGNTSIAELLLDRDGPFLVRLNDMQHLDGD